MDAKISGKSLRRNRVLHSLKASSPVLITIVNTVILQWRNLADTT